MSILIVEDKESLALMLKKTLMKEGFDVEIRDTIQSALEYLLKSIPINIILTDLRLPDGEGLRLLPIAQQRKIPVIVMTAYGSIDIAVKAVKQGAFDFITKPFDIDKLLEIIHNALRDSQSSSPSKDADMEDELIGNSQLWLDVLQKAHKVANQKTTVLLLGESGVGKELIAKYIHNISPRSQFPFIPVNCSAIPKELVESEIFGHEKGAFTGATEAKQGRFELSDKGTIFLDEIGDMEQGLQSKLLRILQDNEFVRVGGTKSIKIDTRVIAATNKNLTLEVEKGNFRRDLFYRLNVFPIFIPPLRERREDIQPLAEYFLKKIGHSLNRHGLYFSKEAMDIIKTHDWLGNVRELKNAIERAVILSERDEIGAEFFKSDFHDNDITNKMSLHDLSSHALKKIERQKIQSVLKETGGNKTKAAEILKVSYKTLLNKIKEYGL